MQTQPPCKRRFMLIGSSHGKKLIIAIYKNPEFLAKFDIFDFTKPGASWNQLVFPEILNTFTEIDVLLLMPFGNDLFNKHIQITRSPKKVIHLTRFEPRTAGFIVNLCQQLKSKVSQYKCQIFAFDNVQRHLFCCPRHIYPGVAKYQKDTNSLIRENLGPKVQALNHTRFLGINPKKVRKASDYHEILLTDSVHMYSRYYEAMSVQLLRRMRDYSG